MISDWVSVSKLDNKTYKPDVGVAIISIYWCKMIKNKILCKLNIDKNTLLNNLIEKINLKIQNY